MFSATWCEAEQNEIEKRDARETLRKLRVDDVSKKQTREATPRAEKPSRALILRVIQAVSQK